MNLLHIATYIPETCPDPPVCVPMDHRRWLGGGQCTLVSLPFSHHAPSLLMCQVLHTQQTCTGHGNHMLHAGALLSHVLGSGATLGSTSPINWRSDRTWLDRQATCLQQPGVTLCPHLLRWTCPSPSPWSCCPTRSSQLTRCCPEWTFSRVRTERNRWCSQGICSWASPTRPSRHVLGVLLPIPPPGEEYDTLSHGGRAGGGNPGCSLEEVASEAWK